LAALPVRELTAAEVSRVGQGLFIPGAAPNETPEIAAVDAGGRLVAILVPRGNAQWGAAKNFLQPGKTD
jgi:hypothetical protein